jgi:uncharacterized protein (TIGR03000 family)
VVIAQQPVTPAVVAKAPASNNKDLITDTQPPEANLYVDNSLCPLTSDVRSFNTPRLEPGKKYYYTMRAEVVQNGQTVVQSQRVTMTAGQQVNVDFGNVTSTAWTAKR